MSACFYCSSLILLIVLTIMSTTHIKRSNKIEDVGHNHLPLIPSSLKPVPDIIVASLIGVCFYVNKSKPEPVLISFIMILIVRLITTRLTVLPPIDTYNCTDRHLLDCTQDYIFSGHMAFSVISILFILNHIPSMTVFLSLLGCIQALLIIGLRNHYTIDVFLGALISYCVYIRMEN